MIEFTLDFKTTKPYSLNAIYSGKKWKERSNDADFIHGLVKYSMMQQHVPRKIFDAPVNIVVFYNDNLDSDNHGYMLKMIVDGLKDYLIKDDSRKYVNMTANAFWDGKDILIHIEEAG